MRDAHESPRGDDLATSVMEAIASRARQRPDGLKRAETPAVLAQYLEFPAVARLRVQGDGSMRSALALMLEEAARTRARGRMCLSQRHVTQKREGLCWDGTTVEAPRPRAAKGLRSDRQSARSSMEHPPVFRHSWHHPAISKPTLDPPSGSPVTVRQNVATGAA